MLFSLQKILIFIIAIHTVYLLHSQKIAKAVSIALATALFMYSPKISTYILYVHTGVARKQPTN